ncbi:MAG: ATP-binding protein, partial [Methanomassiliicoccaceae archaeon]|nr:ATP-binding protein [Methanomassiliicoccaceae archaeon]
KITENLPEYVYDLTVEPSHSFLGNGFVVHNTAAAVKDDFGEGRWTLEAGALVLADKGLACIDELDKMSEQDTSALHEAMESQKISIAKAGITATLQCRCSMLAAANPKRGRFEAGEIVPQINLLPTLMSRFDMIFVIRDIPKKDDDKRIAEHILKAHRRGQVLKGNISDEKKGRGEKIMEDTESIKPVYEPEILRKYVAYSKRIVPVISDDAFDAIEDNYLKIRGTAGGESKTVPITARQLEAYIRLSEASARARLSDTVTKEDAERSIKIIHYYLDKTIGTDAGGGKTVWDMDKITTGIPATVRNDMHVVMEAIREYESEKGMGITLGELVGKLAGQVNEIEISRILDKLQSSGELYCPSIGVYKVG